MLKVNMNDMIWSSIPSGHMNSKVRE